MRVFLLLCAAIALVVAASGQPILPTQRMALGLSYEPESGCVFIIFLDRVKVHCHPVDGGTLLSLTQIGLQRQWLFLASKAVGNPTRDAFRTLKISRCRNFSRK
jgi:hypothetical protein